MILVGLNRVCRGRRPLAFLGYLLKIFLVSLLLFTLERHVVYTITQEEQTIQIRNSKKTVKTVL